MNNAVNGQNKEPTLEEQKTLLSQQLSLTDATMREIASQRDALSNENAELRAKLKMSQAGFEQMNTVIDSLKDQLAKEREANAQMLNDQAGGKKKKKKDLSETPDSASH